MNNEIEVLRYELKLVAENAPKGSHAKVAKRVKISEQQLVHIRNGNIKFPEDGLLDRLIKEYRRLINKEINKLSKL